MHKRGSGICRTAFMHWIKFRTFINNSARVHVRYNNSLPTVQCCDIIAMVVYMKSFFAINIFSINNANIYNLYSKKEKRNRIHGWIPS